MKLNELDALIENCLEGRLTDVEAAKLSALLEESGEARARYWENASIHGMLEHTIQSKSLQAVTGQSFPTFPRTNRWMHWRLFTAAAAGIVLGMLCTSLVFGYSMPRVVHQILSLANPGFEETVPPLPDGIPMSFGVWSGDYSETVGGQQGIVPREGKRMFRFLRSDSRDGFPSRAHHGNIYQFIDIRQWREAIAVGTAVVDWSAWFNCIREQSGAPPQFEASLWAFAGEPSFVRKNWEERLHQELAYSTWRVTADEDPATWQRVAGSLIVPPETDFLVVELKVIAGKETPVNGVVSFAGHYADDVQMVLRTNAREQFQKLPRARP
ncbi:MAG: hypothetical protein EBS01_03045 [Verrucomicrobia bacterium]|nr:hypothetical protein [Verrucomicrobiota bacterium]